MIPRVRFIRDWQGYRKGHEIKPPSLLREWLLNRGFIEIIEDTKPLTEPKKRNTRQNRKPKRSK